MGGRKAVTSCYKLSTMSNFQYVTIAAMVGLVPLTHTRSRGSAWQKEPVCWMIRPLSHWPLIEMLGCLHFVEGNSNDKFWTLCAQDTFLLFGWCGCNCYGDSFAVTFTVWLCWLRFTVWDTGWLCFWSTSSHYYYYWRPLSEQSLPPDIIGKCHRMD